MIVKFCAIKKSMESQYLTVVYCMSNRVFESTSFFGTKAQGLI